MREKIKHRLKSELEKHEHVLAFFEGGSASFGRADEWSDLDLQMVVRDDFVEQAIKILEQTLQKIAPIEDKFVLPAPTWHGQWQGHYKLEGVSPFLLIDALIMKESSPTYYSEPELHGQPVIFFDRTGKIGNEQTNPDDRETAISKRLQRADNLCTMMHLLADKEIRRNRITDAFELYYNLYLRTYVELLRIKYDRARWFFGPRYLRNILPENVYNSIADFFYVSDTDDLLRKKDEVISRSKALIRELQQDTNLNDAQNA